MRQIALLRAINVGGHNKVPMKALVGTFERLGYTDVQTYIQSGNVAFTASGREAEIVSALERAIAEDFGFSVPVIVRTAEQWRLLARNNPYLAARVDPGQVHIGCLSGVPKAGATLDLARSPGDGFTLLGRELYLHLPNGVGKSKFTNDYIERQLGVSVTIRNWNTVKQLVAMSESSSG